MRIQSLPSANKGKSVLDEFRSMLAFVIQTPQAGQPSSIAKIRLGYLCSRCARKLNEREDVRAFIQRKWIVITVIALVLLLGSYLWFTHNVQE